MSILGQGPEVLLAAPACPWPCAQNPGAEVAGEEGRLGESHPPIQDSLPREGNPEHVFLSF